MGDEDVGPTCGIATFCCGLLLMWPAAIFLTGWNEHTAVCRQWAIEDGEDNVVKLSCDSRTTAIDGKPVTAGNLGFVSCPVNKSTFKPFTGIDFPGLAGITEGKLFASGAADAAAMSMTVSMYQCKENCVREECDRRLETANEIPSDVDEEKRSLLTRRLGAGTTGVRKLSSKSNSKSCTPRCVEWDYYVEKSAVQLSQSFQRPSQAKSECGAQAGHLVFPQEPKMGTSYAHAAVGQVHLEGGAWKLNEFQLNELPIDKAVQLQNRNPTGTIQTSSGSPPSSLNNQNTAQQSNTIYTCQPGSQQLGCLEITFNKAAPTTATILSGVGTSTGLFEETGWTADGYWLCKDSNANKINRVCPASLSVGAYTGAISCGEDVNTMEKLTTVLKKANSMKQWVLRAIGFILFWCSINMCFQPIKSLLGFITNMMDAGTDCIPCVGCCVDTLTDIFMGVVKAILCIVSFCCAGACFLFVIAVMWIVMRPIMGSIMFIVMCCCCAGASGLLWSQRSPGARGKPLSRRDSQDSEALSNEDDMSDEE